MSTFKPVMYPFEDPKGPHVYRLCGIAGGFITEVKVDEWWPDIIVWKGRYFICFDEMAEYRETLKWVVLYDGEPK